MFKTKKGFKNCIHSPELIINVIALLSESSNFQAVWKISRGVAFTKLLWGYFYTLTNLCRSQWKYISSHFNFRREGWCRGKKILIRKCIIWPRCLQLSRRFDTNYLTEEFNWLGAFHQSFMIFQQITFTRKAYSKCNHERQKYTITEN